MTHPMYRLLLAFVLSVALGGCVFSSSSPPSPFLVEFSTDTLLTHALQGDLFIDSDSLGLPTDMVVGKKYIFIGDPQADHSVAIFDKESGDFVAQTGVKGEGAREISFLWSMSFKPGSDAGWVYDPPRTAKYLEDTTITTKSLRLTGGEHPMDPVWVIGDTIISSGLYESGRLGLYAPNGEFIRTLGSIPEGEPDIPVSVLQYAYEAILKTNSTGTRIVAASLNTDRIEIFDTSKMLHLVRGPGFHEPLFSVAGPAFEGGGPRTIIESETTQGYVSVAVTDQFIFALYSGRTRGWIRSQAYYSPPGRIAVVFTWTGTPVGVLELQDGAVQIGVARDGEYLYAIYRRPIPMVLRYEVPAMYQTGV